MSTPRQPALVSHWLVGGGRLPRHLFRERRRGGERLQKGDRKRPKLWVRSVKLRGYAGGSSEKGDSDSPPAPLLPKKVTAGSGTPTSQQPRHAAVAAGAPKRSTMKSLFNPQRLVTEWVSGTERGTHTEPNPLPSLRGRAVRVNAKQGGGAEFWYLSLQLSARREGSLLPPKKVTGEAAGVVDWQAGPGKGRLGHSIRPLPSGAGGRVGCDTGCEAGHTVIHFSQVSQVSQHTGSAEIQMPVGVAGMWLAETAGCGGGAHG